MPFCTNCGHENPEGSNFCGQCGSALIPGAARAATPEKVPTGDTTKAMPAMVEERDTDSLTAEDEAAVNALPSGSALLIVQRGANAGSRFLLDTDLVTVGRHQDSDIFLDDISVSRRHATFTRTPEGTLVKDVTGKVQYVHILDFDSREVRDAFSRAVVQAVLERAPEAFHGEHAA